MNMILPDHHDIPDELYDKFHGDFTYRTDGDYTTKCKICGAEVRGVSDQFSGIAYCSESGAMLFDW